MNRAHAIALGAGFAAATAAPRIARAAVPLRVGISYDEDYAEGQYASELGYFKDAGFDAQITALENGGTVITAVLGGALDVGLGNLAAVSAAHSRGLPIAVIAPGALYSNSATTQAILTANGSTIKTAKDLAGKKVGVTGLSSLLQVGIRSWIDKNGGDSNAVQYIELPTPTMIDALTAGRIDACGMVEPWVSQAHATCRIIGAPFSSIGDRFLITAWVTTRSWVDANRQTARQFAGVVRRTANWVNANPKPSAEILARFLHLSPEVVNGMRRTRMATDLEPGLIQPVIDAAAKYKLLLQPFAAGELIVSS
jgi:NitT/TauT family transport system substrate-binding protein